MSGASERDVAPMESMTGTMSGLGSVPPSSQGVLYGHALSIFSDLVASRNLKAAGKATRSEAREPGPAARRVRSADAASIRGPLRTATQPILEQLGPKAVLLQF